MIIIEEEVLASDSPSVLVRKAGVLSPLFYLLYHFSFLTLIKIRLAFSVNSSFYI